MHLEWIDSRKQLPQDGQEVLIVYLTKTQGRFKEASMITSARYEGKQSSLNFYTQ